MTRRAAALSAALKATPPEDRMNVEPSHKTTLVNPAKLPPKAAFTPEMALRAVIEMRKTNQAGERGYRIRTLSDATGDTRLIQAATRFADDYALGEAGVRGESRQGPAGTDEVRETGMYLQGRLDALTRHREACEAVGAQSGAVLVLVTVECLSARELGRRLAMDHKTAQGRAEFALKRLADHYEAPKPKRKGSR